MRRSAVAIQAPCRGLRLCCPPGVVNQQFALPIALRSLDGDEVGILAGDIVVRRAGWLARMLRECCQRWPQEVLVVAWRLPMALATAQYTGGVPGI